MLKRRPETLTNCLLRPTRFPPARRYLGIVGIFVPLGSQLAKHAYVLPVYVFA